MAKVTVAGNSVIIKSNFSLGELKKVEKYYPEKLTLMGGKNNDEPIFAVKTSDVGDGSINKYGVIFAKEGFGEEKKAIVTISVDGDISDIKAYIADNFGGAISNLNKIEEGLEEVLSTIEEDRKAVIDSIDIAE